jgi:hypothetical protein
VASSTGNLHIVIFGLSGAASTVTSVTNQRSEVYTSSGFSGSSTASVASVFIYYLPAAAAGITSITITASASILGAVVYDCSGAASSSPLDVATGLSNQVASVNPQGPSINAATSGGIVVAGIEVANSIVAPNVDSPFIFDTSDANSGGYAHTLNSASGTFNPRWTQSASGAWGGVIAAFKAAGASSPITVLDFAPGAGGIAVPSGNAVSW